MTRTHSLDDEFGLEDEAWTEEDLDDALAALLAVGLTADADAADQEPRVPQPRRRFARRWAPAAVAAAVAVVAGGAVVVGMQARKADEQHSAAVRTAAALEVAHGVADLGGVRFPVPHGWSVAVTSSGDELVTACVAQVPGPSCDGVTVTVAVPDGPALPQEVDAMVFDRRCTAGGGTVIQLEPNLTMGGRPAVHYFGGGCASDPAAHQWILKDRTLSLVTPPGRWTDELAAVVAGIDLSGWPVGPGEQLVFVTEADATG